MTFLLLHPKLSDIGLRPKFVGLAMDHLPAVKHHNATSQLELLPGRVAEPFLQALVGGVSGDLGLSRRNFGLEFCI